MSLKIIEIEPEEGSEDGEYAYQIFDRSSNTVVINMAATIITRLMIKAEYYMLMELEPESMLRSIVVRIVATNLALINIINIILSYILAHALLNGSIK